MHCLHEKPAIKKAVQLKMLGCLSGCGTKGSPTCKLQDCMGLGAGTCRAEAVSLGMWVGMLCSAGRKDMLRSSLLPRFCSPSPCAA